MMQEYDDDFFFEEDKIKPLGNANESTDGSKVLVFLDNQATPTISSDSPPKENDIQQPVTEEHPGSPTGEEWDQNCVFNDLRKERYQLQHQDLVGMTVTSGSVVLRKDEKNLIGISIGGGAPLCPCLYIVQIFDNSPAAREGTLQSGDELVGVGGQPARGKTKLEVARMIQAAKEEVTINYNKLHADPKQGKTLDIVMKKMKHRLVEGMSSGAADALGLSRAILCNDTLVAKLAELRDAEQLYKRLVDHAKRMLKAWFSVLQSVRALGAALAAAGVREPQPRASAAYTRLAAIHRDIERDGLRAIKDLKPILADMGTHLTKAIPDTKLTIRKYADTKWEYLSYCLKVKEMDDEECGAAALREPLYRVETGNYEYRLILRCRQDARHRFARVRSDVLVKLELLDAKRARDQAGQLRGFVRGLARHHCAAAQLLRSDAALFPVEVDLARDAFQYKCTPKQENEEEDEDVEYAREIGEQYETKLQRDQNETSETEQLLPDLNRSEDMTLLAELGLADANENEFGDFQNGQLKESDDVFDKLLSELSLGN